MKVTNQKPEFEVIKNDGYSTVNLKGTFTRNEKENEELRAVFHKLAKEGEKKILLSFADVSYIDSSFVGIVLSCNSIVRNSGGKLVIFNTPEYIQYIIKIANLSTVMDVCETEAQALEVLKV